MEPGGSVSLYIVEDNPGARIAIRSIVERAGFGIVVGEAADGLTAVEQVLKLKPAIVLMDIVLPRLDGIEAASQSRQHFPRQK